jgi:glucose-6-phosphate-specific signal transduction histidine kinase
MTTVLVVENDQMFARAVGGDLSYQGFDVAIVDEQSVLSVEDDGAGIGDIPLEGLGLRSMRYRAKIIGGRLDVVRMRSGTSVRCSWRDPG